MNEPIDDDDVRSLVMTVAERVRIAALNQEVLVLDPAEVLSVWGFLYMSGYPMEIDGTMREIV